MSAPELPADPNPILPRRYRAKLRLARLALAWERLWPAAWPPLAVAGSFLALALLDVLPILGGWVHAVVLAGFAGAFGYAVYRGWRYYTAPDDEAAQRRLEIASGFQHRPLAALSDTLAAGRDNPMSAALWRLHLKRMEEAARALRVGFPAPGLPRRDPWALRAALLLALVVGLAASWSDPWFPISRAVRPDLGALTRVVPTKFEIWITPPAYTGMAAIFPKAAGEGEIVVPAGSEISAQVSGGRNATLVLGDARTAFEEVDQANRKISATIKDSGRLAVEQSGRALGSWPIKAVPDQPPTIAFAAPPTPSPRQTLRIPYTAADDYGIESAKAVMRRTYEDGAVTGKEAVEFELLLHGQHPKKIEDIAYQDFTPHAWAGLPVAIQLFVTDALGQTGESEVANVVLPERTFRNPVAQKIIAERKRLTTDPDKRDQVAKALAEIASRPSTFEDDTVVFLGLIMARSRLGFEKAKTAIPPVQDLLWDLALRLEDGPLSLVERDLRRAQQQLQRALNQNTPDAELEQLLREVERALNRFMEALAQQALMRPEDFQNAPFDPRYQVLDMSDLRRMMDQIREMIRSGNRDAARDMLAQLRHMLENLRAGMMMPNQGDMQQGQAMRDLQQMIQRQRELLDQTYRQMRERQRGQGRQGQTQQGASEQRSIQEMLRRLRNMMGQGQGEGDALSRMMEQAERAMGDSADALEGDMPGDAVGPQTQALDRLQQLGRGMAQQMMDRFAREPGMPQDGRLNPFQQRRDPMGRPLPNEGDLDTTDVGIPDASDVARARQILDELRRRAGQRLRPQMELDYINRLLDRF